MRTTTAIGVSMIGSVMVHAQTQWTPARTYPPTTSFQKVAFGNGRFVATASAAGLPVVLTSRDGLAWSDPLPAPAESDFDLHLKFVRDRFFLFQQDGVWTSTEGAAWTRFNRRCRRFQPRPVSRTTAGILHGFGLANPLIADPI